MTPTRLTERRDQDGFALLIALVASVLPLLLVLGASSSTLGSRQSRLDAEIDDERALAACESGVDYGIFRASTPLGLTSGATYTRDLGDGISFALKATWLRTDGVNNDGDAFTDETDENIYQLLSVGTYRNATRRVVVYLGPMPTLGTFPAPVTVKDAGYQIQIQDSAYVTGIDLNMDGTAGPGPNQPGMMVEAPTTAASLLASIEPDSQSHVQGNSPAPSYGQTATTVDWNAIQLAIQNAATLVLTGASYSNYSFGNGPLGDFRVIYRNGDVQFQNNSRGAGVMFVTGNLQLQEDFRFDGIIYVGGKVQMQGNAAVFGAVVVGTACEQLQLQGNAKIVYSNQAISLASAALPGKYVLFNGWQEIARN